MMPGWTLTRREEMCGAPGPPERRAIHRTGPEILCKYQSTSTGEEDIIGIPRSIVHRSRLGHQLYGYRNRMRTVRFPKPQPFSPKMKEQK